MATVKRATPAYDLHPSVAYVQAIIANFEAKTGHTLEAWVTRLRQGQPNDPKAWLKGQGLGGTQAGLILQRTEAAPGHAFDDTPEGYLAAAPAYVDRQYSGKKAALRPLFERLVTVARSLGADVKVSPCETIVPFYRHHVFAEVKPFASRLDLGLALGDPTQVADPSHRLKDTGGFKKKDRITHKVELAGEADLDDVVREWLTRAYERDRQA